MKTYDFDDIDELDAQIAEHEKSLERLVPLRNRLHMLADQCPAGHDDIELHSAGGCYVKCTARGCGWSGPWAPTKEDAVIAWNIRVGAKK